MGNGFQIQKTNIHQDFNTWNIIQGEQMKPKTIKSKQIYAETYSIQCTCGGDFNGCMEKNSYYYSNESLASLWECEGCGQQWKLPKNVGLVVKFRKESK